MATVFVTGFPGFLGAELLPRLLRRRPEDVAVCLVQPHWRATAEDKIAQIEAADPGAAGRIRLVEGDITAPDLGLGAEAAALQADVREIYHLAALYDLSCGRDLAMRINVLGTRHTLDFAGGCPDLARYQYVSTCYVSGRYAGIFRETDLVKGQTFNNFYEETKYLAEVEVRERMAQGLPATIYRPSVVMGDSKSGKTQKYDGPYFIIQWLLRSPAPLAVMPLVGDPSMTRFNTVPSDYVLDALTHLSGLEDSLGETYALADPSPMTIEELLSELARATGKRLLPVPLPKRVAKTAVARVPGLYQVLRIPASAIDYFVHPTHYDTTNARTALAGTGIDCPPFPSYVDRLVDFVRLHREIGAKAMV
jgi:thioester reductase-like protein